MTSRASLNHTFRTVWNQALGAMVAVAEIASGAGKGSGSAAACAGAGSTPGGAGRANPALGPLALGIALAFSSPAWANPTGAVAVVGQATLSNPGANQLLVTTQNGAGLNHSVINWQSFSIPAGSATYFAQPSASSTSINRVITDNPSAIFGSLGSNGKLVLVNPSGITVGAGAVVDTAGFTASALSMTDADALAGKLRFGNGQAGGGTVDVQGSILARSGDVVLIAPQISTGKDALIQANGATVLAAGRQVDITGRGLEGIVLQVQAPSDQAVNLGALQGDAVGIFAGTLKHSGAIQATALSMEGGKVVLKALDMADVGGSIQAQKSQGQGGDVLVTADKTVLRETASIATSNTHSGGGIRIGGGWHGEDTSTSNARRTVVMPGASLKADATEQGNGGTVVVWADEATGFGGHISARGGVNGGDGGQVEVSGKQYLDFQGTVDTAAAKGKAGRLLLDPDSITIGTTAAIDGFSGDLNAGNNPILAGQYSGYGSQITATAVSSLLSAGTNVSLAASSGNIDVNTAVSKTGGGAANLTLTTGGNINFNAPVSASSGTLGISANSTSGSVSVSANLNTNGGSVTLSAAGNVSQSGGTGITAASVSASSTGGNVTLQGATNNIGSATLHGAGSVNFNNVASSYTLGGNGTGGLTVSGTGALTVNSALAFDGAMTLSSNGGITLGANVSSSFGLTLTTSNASINQSGGNITVSGLSATAGSGDILLSSSGNAVGTLNLSNSGHITFVDSGNLTVSTYTLGANRNLYFQSGGALTVAGGDINAGSGQISLLSNGGALTVPGNLSGSDILLKGSSGLTVGYNVTGTGNATLLGSSINQVGGALHVSGTTSANAGSGTLSLSQAGNDFTGAVSLTGGSVSIRDANALTLGSGSTTSLSVTTGGAVSQTGALTTGSLSVSASAGGVTLSNAGNSLSSASITSGGAVNLGQGSGTLNLNSVSASSLSVVASGDINVGTLSASGGGDSVVLRTTGHINAGYGASISAGSGRWLMYLTNPDVELDTFPSSLAFKQYNTAFGASILGSGNGVIYNNSSPATLSGTLTGTVSKIYDGNTSISLTGAGVGAVTASISGDVATVSLSGATGTLSDPNVGTNKLVTVSGGTASAHDANGIPIYGYSLAGLSGNIGTVSPAIPIISLTGERFYDGTNIVNASIFTLSGLVNGETLNLSGAGTVADKNAGVNKQVNLGTLSLSNGSGQASNYTFEGGTFTATILPLTISSVSGLTAANKVYDGTTKATINTSNAVLSGILAGDTVSVLSATGAFADKNAGNGKTVTIGNLNFSGADAQNYKFEAASASATADISKATISAIGPIGINNKVYDGTTNATLAPGNPTLTGAVAGDDLRISVGAASFADKNAGNAKTVNLSGIALAGTDAGNYTLGAPTSATSSAAISKATLSGVTGIIGLDKTYDGTTVANIDTAKQVLSGAVAGDNLTLSGIQASFADKNAGANKTINLSGFTLTGGDAANYILNFQSATTSATINQAVLQLSGISVADKVYNGSTDATITTANAKLGGLIGNDNVTLDGFGKAVFASKNVGTQAVSITGLKLGGADAANYALTGNVAAGSATITPLAQVSWTGAGSSANWSDAGNWADKAIPDGANVLAVNIPAGSGSVIFDSNASLQSLSSARPLVLASGSLSVASAINLGSYSQSAGSLTGASSMTVANSFSQSGGTISLSGPLNATQSSGTLQIGSISAPAITLTANSGAINQGGAFSTASLSASANGGISLTAAGNKISAISASNVGSGDITVVNGVPLAINGMSNNAGNVSVDNTGALVTGQQTVTAKGNINLGAHSPLTIGSGGVQAGGDIVLTAGASAGQDDLVINGPVSSSGGSVKLNAGDNLQQNANISAPAGSVTASVAGLISGSGVASGKDVTYTSGGVTVPPPGSASVQVIQTLVATFSDSFNDSTTPAGGASGGATAGGGATQDPAASKDKKKDDLVVAADSNLCK